MDDDDLHIPNDGKKFYCLRMFKRKCCSLDTSMQFTRFFICTMYLIIY